MKTRHAFTLVEILTVCTIIAILATLVTLAAAGAMRAAKRGKIAMEMGQIAMALDRYKAEFGEYPPDMFDNDALVRHVKKRWPRLDLENLCLMFPAGSPAESIKIAINNAYGSSDYGKDVDFTSVGSEIGSLVLWLGGFPNGDGKLSGFYADPENPFTPIDKFDNKSFIDLEIGKNKSVRLFSVGNNMFVPVIGSETRKAFLPIVYFRGLSSGGKTSYMIPIGHEKAGENKQFDFSSAGLGFCVPYAEENNGGVIKWEHPSSFQLIHPGLDGNFGESLSASSSAPLRVIKTGDNIGSQDLDNLTNFSDYKELKSILP
ncbi:MAG: type II secretion system GspH family protein [Planctomycetaceae bacterium]|jgi:prepilin-type N-terminal cleavage/methylation domain-containing protein|nr:type II secretion system GspH family protein [Planctomycetaceae bacterium]